MDLNQYDVENLKSALSELKTAYLNFFRIDKLVSWFTKKMGGNSSA